VPVFDLDDPATLAEVRADPSLYAASDRPVCIDEYQKAPETLAAIKSELNRELSPGRFLLAGSTTRDALPILSEALTGRIHFLEVLPLSQGEILGTEENLLEELLRSPDDVIASARSKPSSTTREDYIEKIVAGGFPLALARAPRARGRWFEDYVRQTLERDVLALSRIRQGAQLRALLERLAGQTGQLLNMGMAASKLGMTQTKTEDYTKLLEAVYLVRRLPAWGKTLRSHAGMRPKIHVVDSGVAAHLLRLTQKKLGSLDPTAAQQFGHLLETFVVGELLKQASWLDGLNCGHWRVRDGGEADFVVEDDRGHVIGFEVKASRQVHGKDFDGLKSLRNAVGQNFLAGIVLSLGERSYTYVPQMHVLPIDRIWTRN
jgi:hypothetical protein